MYVSLTMYDTCIEEGAGGAARTMASERMADHLKSPAFCAEMGTHWLRRVNQDG